MGLINTYRNIEISCSAWLFIYLFSRSVFVYVEPISDKVCATHTNTEIFWVAQLGIRVHVRVPIRKSLSLNVNWSIL